MDSHNLDASNSYIENEICTRLKAIETAAASDVIVCIHPIMSPFDDVIKNAVEDIKSKNNSLLVILETDGGSIETTERIVDVFRHHYSGEVSFIIPNCAMSAGTILVMSGDKIFMDYYSVLGPIDPQMTNASGKMVPALGYLEKYDHFVKKSKSRGGLSQAELAFFLDKFDPAELHWLEQAREHSVDLLQRWLVNYKFKNWTVTSTTGKRVTPKMKADRAKEIANKLNNTRLWRSHGRGLSIDVVRRDLNLIVEDFGSDNAYADLDQRVRTHYRLLKDYMARRGQSFVVQTRESMFAI